MLFIRPQHFKGHRRYCKVNNLKHLSNHGIRLMISFKNYIVINNLFNIDKNIGSDISPA